ncbi:hypothetical protein PR048_007484 [Dryococelus australis]|uniref:Uncharacterized protein n=1 Tax=Dryococelus australis TaxID=614101 RepID=A0ABQ9HUD2_9NEOP|nr:hypothetical protein PR048_007484 [Dryococelus australis]
MWSGAGMKGRGKREFPEKTRRPTTSSGTISTNEDPIHAEFALLLSSRLNSTALSELEPASVLHWLLHSCEATPLPTDLHVIGAHNCEVFIYWHRLTQGIKIRLILNLDLSLGTEIYESEIQNHEISLVQHFYIGTKIKLDPGSELGSFDLGPRKMLSPSQLDHSLLDPPCTPLSRLAREHLANPITGRCGATANEGSRLRLHQLVTYSPAASTTNRESYAARSNQSEIRPVARASSSQSEKGYAHFQGTTSSLCTDVDEIRLDRLADKFPVRQRTENQPQRGRGGTQRPFDYKSATLSLVCGAGQLSAQRSHIGVGKFREFDDLSARHSTALCTLEPQLFVHWLLPQCYRTPGSMRFATCFLASLLLAQGHLGLALESTAVDTVMKGLKIQSLILQSPSGLANKMASLASNSLDCLPLWLRQSAPGNIAAEPIGNVPQLAVANQTEGPFQKPLAPNQRAVRPTSKEPPRNDVIDVQHIYTEVTLAIGSQPTRHALDNFEPIADSQGNKSEECVCVWEGGGGGGGLLSQCWPEEVLWEEVHVQTSSPGVGKHFHRYTLHEKNIARQFRDSRVGQRWCSGKTTRISPRQTGLDSQRDRPRMWESCRTTPLVGGPSRGSPASLAPPPPPPYSPRLTQIGSQDLESLHSLIGCKKKHINGHMLRVH